MRVSPPPHRPRPLPHLGRAVVEIHQDVEGLQSCSNGVDSDHCPIPLQAAVAQPAQVAAGKWHRHLAAAWGVPPVPQMYVTPPPQGPTLLYLASVVRKGRNWMFSTLFVANIWRRSDLGGVEGSGLLGAQQCWGEGAPVSAASRHCTPSLSSPCTPQMGLSAIPIAPPIPWHQPVMARCTPKLDLMPFPLHLFGPHCTPKLDLMASALHHYGPHCTCKLADTFPILPPNAPPWPPLQPPKMPLLPSLLHPQPSHQAPHCTPKPSLVL